MNKDNYTIQIAGVRNKGEAEMIIYAGADCCGFPLFLDIHSEDIDMVHVSELISQISSKIQTLVITYLKHFNEISDLIKATNPYAIQFHGDISPRVLANFRNFFPEIPITKSLIIGKYSTDELKEQINIFQNFCDFFITDTYDSSTGASGATGLVHDWNISRELREYSPKPLILAGGLNPDNVSDAINFVKPFGVDAHTGVENEKGEKDLKKLSDFVRNAKAAFELNTA